MMLTAKISTLLYPLKAIDTLPAVARSLAVTETANPDVEAMALPGMFEY